MLFQPAKVTEVPFALDTVESHESSVICLQMFLDVCCGTHALVTVRAVVRVDARVSLHVNHVTIVCSQYCCTVPMTTVGLSARRLQNKNRQM